MIASMPRSNPERYGKNLVVSNNTKTQQIGIYVHNFTLHQVKKYHVNAGYAFPILNISWLFGFGFKSIGILITVYLYMNK